MAEDEKPGAAGGADAAAAGGEGGRADERAGGAPAGARAAKREREDDGPGEGRGEDAAGKRARAGAADDQVSAALRRITAHIGNPKKFARAAGLLSELLGSVGREHGPLAFEALAAALADATLPVADPAARRARAGLLADVDAREEALRGTGWGAVRAGYRVLHVARGDLLTDDSWAFARAARGVQALAEGLPAVGEGEGEAADRALGAVLARLRVRPGGPGGAGAGGGAAPAGAEGAAPGEDEGVAFEREAVLRSFQAMREMYGKAWARATVDVALGKLADLRGRFCPSQQGAIDDLLAFSKEQRAQRGRGGGGVDRAGATELAEKAWAKQEWVSKRGSVGGGGGHIQLVVVVLLARVGTGESPRPGVPLNMVTIGPSRPKDAPHGPVDAKRGEQGPQRDRYGTWPHRFLRIVEGLGGEHPARGLLDSTPWP